MSLLLGSFFACKSPDPAANDEAPPASADNPASPQRPRDVIVPINTAITSLDPVEANDRNTRVVVAALFDTIINYGEGIDELMPALATSMPTYDAVTRTLSFRVATGDAAARFADDPCFAEGRGRAVVASDVAYSLARHGDQTRPGHSLLAARLDASAGAFEDAIEADDAQGLVRLRLRARAPELIAILANPQMGIVPRECVAYYDGSMRPAFREHPVGSGPFVLDHAASEPGRRVVLQRRPSTPKASRRTTASERVQVEYFRAPETALRLFQHGKLATLSPGQSQFAELFDGSVPKDPRLHVVRTALPSTTMLVFNQRAPLVGHSDAPDVENQHLALRQAIALAFDTARYHEIVRNGAWAEPAVRITPPDLAPDNSPTHPYAPSQRDETRARAALARAGLGRTVTLRYLTSDDESARHEAAIFRQALAPLGVDLDVIHDAAYLVRLATRDEKLGDVHMFSIAFDADYPAAESLLGAFTCNGDISMLAGHCDATYDALFDRVRHGDPSLRDAGLNDLERRLAETVFVRPIDHPRAWLIAQPGVSGIERHPVVGLRLERIAWR